MRELNTTHLSDTYLTNISGQTELRVKDHHFVLCKIPEKKEKRFCITLHNSNTYALLIIDSRKYDHKRVTTWHA